MEFEYDADKSAANKIKHGIDFEEARELWSGEIFTIALSFPYESRQMHTGLIGGKYHSAIVTMRGAKIRIISVRRARKKEIEDYENHRRD